MYVFIINPVAGHGKAKRIFSKISMSHLYKQIDSVYFFTKYEGHAEKLVHQLYEKNEFDGISGLIVIGGDGTLHEVINGLGKVRLPLSFIPGGSGNDFARGSELKDQPLKIFDRIISQREVLPYWLGQYEADQQSTRYFVNSVGVGYDAEIVKVADESLFKPLLNKLYLGQLIYVFALIKALFKYEPSTIEVETDGKIHIFERCWMVTVANHPFYGGGMKILPNATIQPDHFSILVIHNISKWKILALFVTVFTGKHTAFREVDILTAKKVKITSVNKISYQVDGQQSTCQSIFLSKDALPLSILGSKNTTSPTCKIS